MNKLLQLQLQNHFGKAGLLPQSLTKLFDVISESYDNYEKEKKVVASRIEPALPK